MNTDKTLYSAIDDILKQDKELIESLIKHISRDDHNKEKFSAEIDKLTEQAIEIRKALENSNKQDTLAYVQSTINQNWDDIAAYVEATPAIIDLVHDKEQLRRELSRRLSTTKQATSSAIQQDSTTLSSFIKAAKSSVSNKTKQLSTFVSAQYAKTRINLTAFRTTSKEGLTTLRTNVSGYFSWLHGFKDKAHSVYNKGYNAAFRVKLGMSNAYSSLKSNIQAGNIKWIFKKVAMAGMFIGLFSALWKRKDLLYEYVTGKITEWKDRAVLTIQNMIGNLKTKVSQFRARLINGVIDFFSYFIPDELEKTLKQEIPSDYVDKEYIPKEAQVSFEEVLRGRRNTPASPSVQASSPQTGSNQQSFDQAMKDAANKPSMPVKPKDLTEVSNSSIFSLNGASKLLSAIGSPFGAIVSLTSLLFSDQSTALKRATSVNSSDLRSVSNKMGSTGIGSLFNSLTNALKTLNTSIPTNNTGVDTSQNGWSVMAPNSPLLKGKPEQAYTGDTTLGSPQSFNPRGLGAVASYVTGGTINTYTKWCGRGVANILGQAGYPGWAKPNMALGRSGWRPAGANGGDLDSLLSKRGWTRVDPSTVREGDVRIGKNRGAGHAEIFAGGYWYSDTRQNRSITPTARYNLGFSQWRYTGSQQPTYSSPPNLASNQVSTPVTKAPALAKSSMPATSQLAVTNPPTVKSTPVQTAKTLNRDPIYTEPTWQAHKASTSPTQLAQNTSKPAIPTPTKKEQRVLVKSPSNRGMSEVLISDYIG